MGEEQERYKCATCCYTTTSCTRFIEHGKTHGMSADKPAATATEHGTGSEEAKDWFESMPSLSDVPTPPASPTVTLRDALDLLQQVQNDTMVCNGFVHADLRVKIRALLRAAPLTANDTLSALPRGSRRKRGPS